MKYFAYKVSSFFVIICLLSWGMDSLISTGLKKSENKLFHNLTKINKGEINADLIINGSSKALVQVNPLVLDTLLDINSYNLGLDGTPFIPQKAQFELYKLHNVKPKYIVQIVSNGTLRNMDSGFRNHIKFAPYLNVDEVENLMLKTGSYNYLDYRIPLYKYAGNPFEIGTGILSYFGFQLFKATDQKGYFPQNKEWEDIQLITPNTTVDELSYNTIDSFIKIDPTSRLEFESFLEECKNNQIIVFLVYPPIHSSSSATIKNNKYYEQISKEFDFHFLDYSQDSSFSFNKDYFYNSQHLNSSGADLFSLRLATDIKMLIK